MQYSLKNPLRRVAGQTDVIVKTAKLFSRLGSDYDLRSYRAISPTRILRDYNLQAHGLFWHLDAMVGAGLLEAGPVVREPSLDGSKLVSVGTYRLTSSVLLDLLEFVWHDRWKQNTRDVLERRALEPVAPGGFHNQDAPASARVDGCAVKCSNILA